MSEGIIDLARRLKTAMEAAKITGLDLPGMSVVVGANVGSRPGHWQIETSADLTEGSNG